MIAANRNNLSRTQVVGLASNYPESAALAGETRIGRYLSWRPAPLGPSGPPKVRLSTP